MYTCREIIDGLARCFPGIRAELSQLDDLFRELDRTAVYRILADINPVRWLNTGAC